MKARSKLDLEDDDDRRDLPSGQMHECGTCGKHSVWDKNWLWYGSYKQLDDQGLPGVEPIFKACSIECMEKRGEAEANRRRREELARLKAEEEDQAQRLDWLRKKRERAEAEAALSQHNRAGQE